jgi:hypothetical protein
MNKNETVIVSNLFMEPKEFEPYYEIAKNNNYDVIKLFPWNFSSNENPIWKDGGFNFNLLFERMKLKKNNSNFESISDIISEQITKFHNNLRELFLAQETVIFCDYM